MIWWLTLWLILWLRITHTFIDRAIENLVRPGCFLLPIEIYCVFFSKGGMAGLIYPSSWAPESCSRLGVEVLGDWNSEYEHPSYFPILWAHRRISEYFHGNKEPESPFTAGLIFLRPPIKEGSTPQLQYTDQIRKRAPHAVSTIGASFKT